MYSTSGHLKKTRGGSSYSSSSSLISDLFFVLSQFKSPRWRRLKGSGQATDVGSEDEVVRNWLWFSTSGHRGLCASQSNKITADWCPTSCYWRPRRFCTLVGRKVSSFPFATDSRDSQTQEMDTPPSLSPIWDQTGGWWWRSVIRCLRLKITVNCTWEGFLPPKWLCGSPVKGNF